MNQPQLFLSIHKGRDLKRFQESVLALCNAISETFPEVSEFRQGSVIDQEKLGFARSNAPSVNWEQVKGEINHAFTFDSWRKSVGFNAFLKLDSEFTFTVFSLPAIKHYLPAIMLNLIFFGDYYKNVRAFRYFFFPKNSQLFKFCIQDISQPLKNLISSFDDEYFALIHSTLNADQKAVVAQFTALYFGEIYSENALLIDEVSRVAHLWNSHVNLPEFNHEYKREPWDMVPYVAEYLVQNRTELMRIERINNLEAKIRAVFDGNKPNLQIGRDEIIQQLFARRTWYQFIGPESFVEADPGYYTAFMPPELIAYYYPAFMLNLLYFGDIDNRLEAMRLLFAPVEDDMDCAALFGLFNYSDDRIEDENTFYETTERGSHSSNFWKVRNLLNAEQRLVVADFISVYIRDLWIPNHYGIEFDKKYQKAVDSLLNIWSENYELIN